MFQLNRIVGLLLVIVGSILCSTVTADASSQDTSAVPSWDELEKRPLPVWYDDAKFGIFIHWGVFSVPSFKTEWFWINWQGLQTPEFVEFVQQSERPGFSYTEYARRFTAQHYDADAWAQVFAQSGAQYVVLTSKHHEGYCMWNSTNISSTYNWNVMDVGPRRDVLGELARSIKQTTSPMTDNALKFGVYHSLLEWFNPMYVIDKANNFTTREFVRRKTNLELRDLVRRYEPELIWSDGEWESQSEYWEAREFLHWYGTKSAVAKTAVWNDRWGQDVRCKVRYYCFVWVAICLTVCCAVNLVEFSNALLSALQFTVVIRASLIYLFLLLPKYSILQYGSFLTCEDNYEPATLNAKKWEDALTIDKTSWGYNRNATYDDYMTTRDLVHQLVRVVSKNGNMLLNVGPAADGTIHPIFINRLLGIGKWLAVNGESIFKSRPWNVCQNDTNSVYYTTSNIDRNDGATRRVLYAHVTVWPRGNVLTLDCPVSTAKTRITMLGWNGTISYTSRSGLAGINIQMPALTPDIIPCEHAWVLAITGLANF
jgi:alpha-L-fucosidase